MGDRPTAPRALVVAWDYRVDRLLAAKLAHADQLLVPDQRWPVGVASAPLAEEQVNRPARSRVRPRVVGSATGAADDRELDGRAPGAGRRAGLRRWEGDDAPGRGWPPAHQVGRPIPSALNTPRFCARVANSHPTNRLSAQATGDGPAFSVGPQAPLTGGHYGPASGLSHRASAGSVEGENQSPTVPSRTAFSRRGDTRKLVFCRRSSASSSATRFRSAARPMTASVP